MKRPEPLEIYQPTSIQEACQIIKKNGPGGHYLAGGTDLVIAIKEKGWVPRYVVDIKRIPSMSGIRDNLDGSLTIGALTTMREIETSPLILKRYPFFAQSAAEVGSIQIRNRATIGGNMANATPSADAAPALIALDTKAKISGGQDEEIVSLEAFFVGPGKTVMKPDEILTELIVPAHPATLRGEYIKFSPREMMDLAYIGVAVALVLDNKRKIEYVRIVLGAVAPTPLRARNAEAILTHQVLTEELAERAGEEAAKESKPISDVRSSADYRREMVRVNTKRALLNAAADPRPISWLERRDRRY